MRPEGSHIGLCARRSGEPRLRARPERPDETWFPEARSPGHVLDADQKGEHFLAVSVQYDTERVLTKITASRNRGQTEGKLRHAAYEWIDELEWRIRRNQSAMAGQLPSAPSPL